MISRKALGICLSVFALCIVILCSVWLFGKDSHTPPEEQRGTELVEMVPAKTNPNRAALKDELPSAPKTIETPVGPVEEPVGETYQFVLVNNNDYVTVYRLPENVVYEYTDVIMDVLPFELQEEIRDGKFLKTEEELYNFLENYTS